MTSRLKRKLGEMGVDTSTRKANENFCLIGTPLPPLEKSKDTGEFVPLWKQEVRDEKGRRRLHGAFTGGFSAGYFNTVGSKEGWTPKTFVSSRNDRAKKTEARPEDFMDDEDLQDLKESRDLVDTTEEMDFLGGTQAELLGKEADDADKDPITLALQASTLPAPKDSVGAQILKKMGWRLGQGIGPRISLKQRRMQDAQAYDVTTGAKFQGVTLEIADDDEEASKHTYAPRDTPVLAVKRKDNSHGLGYTPGKSLQESLGNNVAAGSKGPKLAGGFGLGALNEAEEDDLDVYDGSHRPGSGRRHAYDHVDLEDDETVVIGRNSRKSQAPAKQTPSLGQYFRDGRPVLAGFLLSDEPVAEDRWFPVPEVPSGWTSDPQKVWQAEKENLQHHPLPDSQTHAQWKKSKLSANERGAKLGETPLPAAARSVFDYMSQKDKERIKAIAEGLSTGGPSSAEETPKPPPISVITKLEPHVAQAALRGFQPFTSDPSKQARYNTYLLSQANPDGSAPALKPLPGQGPEDFNKELGDYAKSASLFKPISGAMAGRFTSAAIIDFGPKIQEGLHTPSHEEIAAKEAEKRKEEEDKISPKVHAAKMGMFGPLTREIKPWQPAKLLCKRFGVKEPNVELQVPSDPVASSSKSSTSFTDPEQNSSLTTTKDEITPIQTSTGPRDLANIGLGEDETQGQDTLTYQRPSMDIFKAIFASDDDDSDDDAQEDEVPTKFAPPANSNDTTIGFTSATTILDDTPVDINNFKPKFIPREGKSKKSKDGEKDRERKEKKDKKKKEKKGVLVSFEMDEGDDRERKEKKDKKKKEKKGVLVSFEMDEGDAAGGESEVKQSKDRPKKKQKKEEKKIGVHEEDMWEIIPPPEAVVPVAASVAVPSIAPDKSLTDTGPKGRKRAIDFM